jgi:hypothetical protein
MCPCAPPPTGGHKARHTQRHGERLACAWTRSVLGGSVVSARTQQAAGPTPSILGTGKQRVNPVLDAIAVQVVEQLAPRIEQWLDERLSPTRQGDTSDVSGPVDAATLAKQLGVARAFVYEHADELGAQRLGDGPRARLRFDVETAKRAMFRSSSERSRDDDSLDAEPKSKPRTRRRSGTRRAEVPDSARRLTPRGPESDA